MESVGTSVHLTQRQAAADLRDAPVDHTSDQAYWESIEGIVEALRRLAARDQLPALSMLAREHPEWPVRAACVRMLGEAHGAEPAAHAAIAGATHDEVDQVAFTAIQVAGQQRVRLAIRDLIRISGWPSNFTQPGYARKPVGCGAAFTKRALVAIFGSSDPAQLRQMEDEHFADVHERVAGWRRPREDHQDTVLIPAGPFVAGATAHAIGPFQINDADGGLRAVDLPDYLIDRTAVTNERYARFLDEAQDTVEFDHPDQPSRRDHMPAHWHDSRFNRPELPAVGMDWYDAWAFAKWAGGRLPSEDEWEKAARGQDGRTFPWGSQWSPERANYVERSFGVKVGNLQELEETLVTVGHGGVPAEPLMPADSLPEGASPYGLLHMAGNVWEMTRTNYFSRDDLDPFFLGHGPIEFMNRREAFYSIRGGTWTSPPVCLTTHYRGKDLLTDKHNEIGFRCVYDA